jgi:hypothetical protein
MPKPFSRGIIESSLVELALGFLPNNLTFHQVAYQLAGFPGKEDTDHIPFQFVGSAN